MLNILRLMKRKSESDSEDSFLEYVVKTLYNVFKKITGILIKVIKKVINWMLNG